MPTEILIQRTLDNKLVPVYPSDLDKLKKLSTDNNYSCSIKRPRNLKHHKKFFTLVELVWQNLPEKYIEDFKSKESLLNEFKFQTGHHKEHRTLSGRITYIPKSISFAAMDQEAFDKFYDKCLDIVLKYFFVGMDKKALRDEVINSY